MVFKRNVTSMQFDIFSAETIRSISVCEITEAGVASNGVMIKNGLNDLRMGPSRDEACLTCGGRLDSCPGHFAHVELATPVYHVGFLPMVYTVLKQLCPTCGELVKPTAKVCTECNSPVPHRRRKLQTIVETFTEAQRLEYNGRESLQLKRQVSAAEAKRRLDRLNATQCAALGIANPSDLILTVLPVAPPQARPSVEVKGRFMPNDTTLKYNEVLQANQRLRDDLEAGAPQHILSERVGQLQWHVSTLLDSSLPTEQRSASFRTGEPRQGLRQRLCGKQGRVRGNLMGKRCDFSARSVITADPNLDIDQVGVPRSIALKLSVPERVTRYNQQAMHRRIQKGPSSLSGARYLIKGETRYDLNYCRYQTVDIGDIVERPLQDDDLVVMNRQPSLHKMSMMAHRVKILPFSTFRLNLSVTSPYNAGTCVKLSRRESRPET